VKDNNDNNQNTPEHTKSTVKKLTHEEPPTHSPYDIAYPDISIHTTHLGHVLDDTNKYNEHNLHPHFNNDIHNTHKLDNIYNQHDIHKVLDIYNKHQTIIPNIPLEQEHKNHELHQHEQYKDKEKSHHEKNLIESGNKTTFIHSEQILEQVMLDQPIYLETDEDKIDKFDKESIDKKIINKEMNKEVNSKQITSNIQVKSKEKSKSNNKITGQHNEKIVTNTNTFSSIPKVPEINVALANTLILMAKQKVTPRAVAIIDYDEDEVHTNYLEKKLKKLQNDQNEAFGTKEFPKIIGYSRIEKEKIEMEKEKKLISEGLLCEHDKSLLSSKYKIKRKFNETGSKS